MSDEIILGTAQFGMPYGVTNALGIPDDKELSEIFDVAQRLNISTLDTATVYGNSHQRIGRNSAKPFQIITKLPAGVDASDVYSCVKNILQELQQDKLYGVLLHSQEDLSRPRFDSVLRELQELKKRGLVENIGASVYELSNHLPIFRSGKLDIVQLPLNVLDNRASESIYRLKEVCPTLKIHCRSVFLQGALVSCSSALPKKLSTLIDAVDDFKSHCDRNNIEAGSAALKFVFDHPIDAVVVGVTCANELLEIESWLNQAKFMTLSYPGRPFNEQFDPRNW